MATMDTQSQRRSIDKPWQSSAAEKWKTHVFAAGFGPSPSTKVPLGQKKVSFSTRDSSRAQWVKEITEDPRNLGTSRNLRRQFKDKPSSRFFPDVTVGSETRASFIYPGLEAPIPLPPRNPKVHFVPNLPGLNQNVFQENLHQPRQNLDALEQIKGLKSRILAGENVSMGEIHAVRNEVGQLQTGAKGRVIEEPVSIRQLKRKTLFCEKGIVKVPTPHNPHCRYNSFGSPADLRISLSNSDTPEYQDRRRYFFDFTGFLDKDIKLFLENKRRLIIKGNRPSRGSTKAQAIEEEIDLPKDLPVDNLRIVRDVFGTLIVEEAWRFM